VYVVTAMKPMPMHRLQIHPNSAQPEGTRYHSPKLHLGLCSSVGMQQGADRHTHEGTQTAMANKHFASAMPHARCNYVQSDYVTVHSLMQ